MRGFSAPFASRVARAAAQRLTAATISAGVAFWVVVLLVMMFSLRVCPEGFVAAVVCCSGSHCVPFLLFTRCFLVVAKIYLFHRFSCLPAFLW
jgi:uncharacterized membrane protein